MLKEAARLVQDAVDRAYRNGRFHEFLSSDDGGAGGWHVFLAHWRFRRSGADGALDRARTARPDDWDPVDAGWRSLLSYRTDGALLAVPGIGRRRLRAIRALAPRSPWLREPDEAPHRDRLRPLPPKGRHPWWLLP